MQIILKQDVKGLGYEYDVVNVKPGYARNYLIPRGMAIIATPSNLKVRNETVKQKAHKEEKIIKDANELAKVLEKIELKFVVKAQESGKIYGSITQAMIVDAIKEKYSYDLDKNNVLLANNIKEVGSYDVKIKVFKDIQPKVKILVERELTEEEIAEAKAKAAEKKAAELKKIAEENKAKEETKNTEEDKTSDINSDLN